MLLKLISCGSLALVSVLVVVLLQGLQQLSSSFSLDWRIVAAGSVVSILPVLVLFVLLQRFILPNASGDAVKG